MALYRTTAMIGYSISAIVGLLWLSVLWLPLAVILYPLTIIFRGIGWAFAAKEFNRKAFFAISIVILLGGLLLYTLGLNIIPIPGVSQDLDPPKLKLLAGIWIVYSLAEFVSYILMRRHSKIFLGALTSIIGIGIIAFFLQASIADTKDFIPFVLYAVPFLILSAICAAIGFAKLKPSE